MEKLIKNSNGQWKLIKAWGDPDYDTISHGNSPFKDTNSAQKAKIAFIDHIKNNSDFAKYKNMPNIHTGEKELHVLLHRGMTGEEAGDIKPNGVGIDAKGKPYRDNLLDWSNGKTVKTKTNSIHTLHSDEGEGHAESDQFGHLISFWAPISSIHGLSHHVNNDHLASGVAPEIKDPHHTVISPGEYPIHTSVPFLNGKKTG